MSHSLVKSINSIEQKKEIYYQRKYLNNVYLDKKIKKIHESGTEPSNSV